jgi:hypothetical protein
MSDPYREDIVLWSMHQAELPRRRAAGELVNDAEMNRLNIAEEIESVGRADIWLYATPIVHASGVATRTTRRRVFQVDYSADELPGGLRWLAA